MKLAIFDIDGTLTNSHGFDTYFFDALARRAGVANARSQAIDQWTHVTDESIAHEYLTQHGPSPTPDDIAWVKDAYAGSLRTHLRAVPPMPGAAGVLRSLRDHPDWHVAIATGNWTFAGQLKLAAGGLDVAGIDVVGCDARPRREDLMQHALTLSEAACGPFAHVVYVGDAAWDVHATRALGWNFLGLNADPERLLRLGATHVLPDYTDLDATHAALVAAGVPAAQRVL